MHHFKPALKVLELHKATAFLILIFSFLSFLPAKGQGSDTVAISLGWYPQFQFAGIYAALDKGYYAEEGLTVVIKTHDESKTSVGSVLSGDSQYGIGTGSMLLGSREVNNLVVVAAYQQQSPVVLVCLEERKFEKLRDFEGMKVHGGTEIKAMFNSAGVEFDSIGSPLDIPEIRRLESREIDAMTMYITDLPKLNTNSTSEFKIFKPANYGISFYGECLFTSKEEVENNSDRVEALIKATKRGWEYALENKSEISNLLLSKYGSSFTYDQLMEEAQIVEESLIIPSLYEIGSIQINKWAEMSKILNTVGILNGPIDLDSFIYQRKEDAWGPFVKKSLLGLSIITAILVVWAIVLIIFNTRLRKEVNRRTDDLKHALEKLNLSLDKEKHITDNLEKLVKERTSIIEEQKIELEEINSELETRVRDRTRNLQKSNKELDMFIYSMSHDIRAPLASIQGLINVIEINPEKKDEYIELIAQNVRQLDFFIEEILEYTRNTKRALNTEVINLKSLVTSIFEELKYLPGHERVQPIIDIDDNSILVSDKTRTLVVLRNLISNAIKYQDMSKKNPFVRVSVASDKDTVSIKVEDNGIGISEEHLTKVYDMFYRATENSKGSGLGLYIVKEILTNMNGSIELKSTAREGTTFELQFQNQQVPETIA